MLWLDWGPAATLSIEDARAIENSLEGISFVASGVHENARVTLSEEEGGRNVHADPWHRTNTRSLRAGWTYSSGRFFSESEFNAKSNVMVLGQVVSDRLFGTKPADPVGETVFLWNQRFEVVGVVE